MKPLIIIFLALGSLGTGYAQNKLDSLENALLAATVDSSKVKLLHQLFGEYRYEEQSKAKSLILEAIDLSTQANLDRLSVEGMNLFGGFLSLRASYDSAISEYDKALLISEKIEYHVGFSEALTGMGDVYWRKGDLKKAQEYHERNMKFSESIGNVAGIAGSYNSLGNINNDLAEYTKAMEYYTLAAKTFEELGDEQSTSIALTNVGVIHQRLENYDKAISYYQTSDSIFKKMKFHRGTAFISGRLATVYKNLGEYEISLEYSQKALEGFEKIGSPAAIAEIKHNIGNLYWDQEKYNEALPYYLEARAINMEIGDTTGIAFDTQAVGGVYFELGNLEKAVTYLNEALSMAKAKDARLTVMDSYETLAAVYFEKKDFQNAYQSLDNFAKLRDSLYTIEKRDLASDIEAKYQNEKKAKEIALLESENQLQSLQIEKRENERNYLIAFALAALILVILVYNQYRIKQKANKKLKELDRMKTSFFENLSHEFRTPLTLIMAPLKEKMEAADEEEKKVLSMMLGNSEKLLKLINELLDLAKLEAGALEIHKSSVEVSHFFKILASSYDSYASSKSIIFNVHLLEEETCLMLDQELVSKVCNNLLSNAFKFTQEGGEVGLHVSYDDGVLKIRVTDNGIGIPMADREKIFNRFEQGERSGNQQQGTGIGLALVKELTEAHGGEVVLESITGEDNQGTSFTLSIPLEKGTPKKEEQLSAEGLSNIELQATTTKVLTHPENENKVLVIEDNDELRDYITQLLSDSYHVLSAVNGQDGLETAIDQIPDLIISDVMMPEMDGLELCEKLNQIEETDHIPVILLTARADTPTKMLGLQLGAIQYVTKPFEPEELKFTIDNIIQQQKKLKDKYLSRESPKKNHDLHPFIKKCENIIMEHLDDAAFDISLFAREVGMSRMQLHRKLVSLTNLSATAFIRYHRLNKAKQLLEEGEHASQVAYGVGFSSLSYFSTSFKKQFGKSPSEYSSS